MDITAAIKADITAAITATLTAGITAAIAPRMAARAGCTWAIWQGMRDCVFGVGVGQHVQGAVQLRGCC